MTMPEQTTVADIIRSEKTDVKIGAWETGSVPRVIPPKISGVQK